MKLYIDPGTGSMLFAILIGIIGALNFALRGWIIKLRFLLSGGEKTAVDQEKHPLAVFVDDKRYWNVMEPVCRELDRRGLDVAYLTASPDDPALQNPYAHVHAEFLGEGNRAFAKLNFLRANVLLSSTPGLDVYQWKRSPGVDCYVHILHAANEVAGYRMFFGFLIAMLLLGAVFVVVWQRFLRKHGLGKGSAAKTEAQAGAQPAAKDAVA